ncbi:MAG TPA: ECF-type sigma factor [Dokdonella sp.]|uniref:ECF-type sigma factor n=1 Tax=Dokdonella sp. TaxID=2291710 RepID=UPI002D8027C4|nr:ECF-type sigma factor [Dokdonella sp.]HET9032919.1 ECF-type sigma factor [Dokdonella sp.]
MPPSETTHEVAVDALSADVLFAAVYERLKGMASNQLARSSDATLNTTGLVHELYVKVSAARELEFSDPAQFFSYASQAMRHILVDHARQRLREKRGAGVVKVNIDDVDIADLTATQVLGLDEALRLLESSDPRAGQLVTLHYFAGLPLAKISELLGVTERTLNRDWRFARAYLHDLIA